MRMKKLLVGVTLGVTMFSGVALASVPTSYNEAVDSLNNNTFMIDLIKGMDLSEVENSVGRNCVAKPSKGSSLGKVSNSNEPNFRNHFVTGLGKEFLTDLGTSLNFYDKDGAWVGTGEIVEVRMDSTQYRAVVVQEVNVWGKIDSACTTKPNNINNNKELKAVRESEKIKKWAYPVNGAIIKNHGFMQHHSPIIYHSGIDLGATKGDPIKVVADGVVAFVENDSGFGLTIVVNHSDSLSTLYAHADELKVKEGQKVKAGDIIGLVGQTGKATEPQLHFEVRLNGESVNPRNYLAGW